MEEFQPTLNSPSHEYPTSSFPNNSSQSELYELPCKILKDTELSQSENLWATISEPERNPEISFMFKIHPLGWTGRRTLQDFIWIRNVLVASHAGVYVPPAVSKRYTGNYKTLTVSKNLEFIQKFLQSLINHPELQKSPYLIGFLKQTDQESFEDFRVEASKARRYKRVEEQATLKGLAICDTSRNTEEIKVLDEYLSASFALHRNIKRQAEKLESCLEATAEAVWKISESAHELSILEDKVSNCNESKEAYLGLHEMMASWNRSELEKVKTVKESLSQLFKFTYNEFVPLKDLIKEKEVHFEVWKKTELKINKLKEKLFVMGDISKWKLSSEDVEVDVLALKSDKELAFSKMLYEDSERLERLQNVYAFHNFKLFEEINWFLHYSNYRNIGSFQYLASKEGITLSRYKTALEKFSNLLDQHMSKNYRIG